MYFPIKISKFSSIAFQAQQYSYFDEPACYIQKFSRWDSLRIQFSFTDRTSLPVIRQFVLVFKLNGEVKYSVQSEIAYQSDNEDVTSIISEFKLNLSRLDENLYDVEIQNESTIIRQTKIQILLPRELADTVLIECTNYINDFDTIFTGRSFSFRVEGGIYQGEIEQNIKNETFRDQRYKSYQLSAIPYQTKTLTIGTCDGVPQWVGNKINWIFSVSNVYVNSIATTRSEDSVPELNELGQYYPLYVFKLNVEQEDYDSVDGGGIGDFNQDFNIDFLI
jgi:hypothetical protein